MYFRSLILCQPEILFETENLQNEVVLESEHDRRVNNYHEFSNSILSFLPIFSTFDMRTYRTLRSSFHVNLKCYLRQRICRTRSFWSVNMTGELTIIMNLSGILIYQQMKLLKLVLSRFLGYASFSYFA